MEYGTRAPYVVATENDSLNGASMLFGYLLTNTAQIFADVRTYWSPESVKRVSGHTLEGAAAGGILHLINSGAATLDRCIDVRYVGDSLTVRPETAVEVNVGPHGTPRASKLPLGFPVTNYRSEVL